MQNEKVIDESGDKKYFTQIPNIIDELNLSPLEIALYFHYKCQNDTKQKPKGTRFLAQKFGVSLHSIKKAKINLKTNGLISIKTFPKKDGRPDEITILDIWKRNFEHFHEKYKRPDAVQHQGDFAKHQVDSPKNHPCIPTASGLMPDSITLKDKEIKEVKKIGGKTMRAQEETQPPAALSSDSIKIRQWNELTAEEKKMSLEDFKTHLQTLHTDKNVPEIANKLKQWCIDNKKDFKLERLKGWVEGEARAISDEEFLKAFGDDGKRDWKKAIEDCPLCDEQGMNRTGEIPTVCRHPRFELSFAQIRDLCGKCDVRGLIQTDKGMTRCSNHGAIRAAAYGKTSLREIAIALCSKCNERGSINVDGKFKECNHKREAAANL